MMVGGGTVTVSASGEVVWTEDIILIHGVTGATCTIAAGSLTLPNGGIAHATVARGSTESYVSALTVTQSLTPQGASVVPIFARNGNQVWMRQRGVISVGSALERGFVPGQDKLIRRLPLVVNRTEGIESVVLGRVTLNSDDYDLAGALSLGFDLVVESQITTLGQTANLSFHNVTGAPVLITDFTQSSLTPTINTVTFVPPLGTSQTFELRGGLDALGGPYLPTDLLQVWQAYIKITNTY